MDCLFSGDVCGSPNASERNGLLGPAKGDKVEIAGVGYVDYVTLGRNIKPIKDPVREATEAITETGQI